MNLLKATFLCLFAVAMCGPIGFVAAIPLGYCVLSDNGD